MATDRASKTAQRTGGTGDTGPRGPVGPHPGAGSATDPKAAPPSPGGPALELLVHGVGGTTPQEMLDDPRTVRITGDGTAGIHRAAADADAEDRPHGPEGRPVAEAYCWSNLTSGNSARALWLILLPFMVANLAHWMRPAAPARHPAQRLYDVLVRLVALSLTVLLVAAACEVALDLVAWQCAGRTGCARDKSWLHFLTVGQGGWWSLPGRRLVLAALLPVALTGLLWWLSHRTWSAYESASPPPRVPGPPRGVPEGEQPALSLRGFWYGRRLVSRLRAAHTAAALLTVASVLLSAVPWYQHRSDGGPLETLGWSLAVLVASCWIGVLLVTVRRGRTESEPDERLDRTAALLPTAALAVLVLTAVHTAWDRPAFPADGRLLGNGFFASAALLQAALVGLVAVVAVVLHRAARTADAAVPAAAPHRTAMGGLGGAAVALLACALGGVLTGGVAQRVAASLAPEGAIPGPPPILTWQAAVIPPLLVVVLLFTALTLVRLVRLRGHIAPTVLADYDGEHQELDSRSKRIAGARARAALTDSAPVLVGSVAVCTLLLGTAAVLGALLTGEVPARAARGAPALLPAVADLSQALGSWLMGAGVVLLLTMGRTAYRDPAARRTVGILWDVGTFWPRAAHPFAPPCYAERAVPDLTWRISTWTESTGGRLVVSGHSQGSVLAAAAVWQLDPVTRSRVALLSYGSPLERLYGRWFPAHFGPVPLEMLYREVNDWRNLWRSTDPIGGPVRVPYGDGPEVDRGPLKDPLAYGRTLRNPLPAPILGHFDYQADPAFEAERAALLARLASSPAERGGGKIGPQPGPSEGSAATGSGSPRGESPRSEAAQSDSGMSSG